MEERQVVVVGGRSDTIDALGRSLVRKGLIALACGLLLIFVPATTVAVAVWLVASVSVLFGIGELVDARERARRMRRWGIPALRGLVFLVFAAVLVVSPQPGLRMLVSVTGAVWALGGLLELVDARRAAWGERDPFRTLRGWVWLAGGLVVAVWPDVTVRLVGLLVGGCLVVVGGTLWMAGRAVRRAARLQRPLRLERWS